MGTFPGMDAYQNQIENSLPQPRHRPKEGELQWAISPVLQL
jgi:hypothetical protein